MAHDPGSGQSPRRRARPAQGRAPVSEEGNPLEPGLAPSRTDIDDAIAIARATALRDAGLADVPPSPLLGNLDLRSPDPQVCPFLRAIDDDEQLAIPIGAPDALNRCAALREAIPQSLRQQELVCLTSGHELRLRGVAGALDGGRSLSAEISGPVSDAVSLGQQLAQQLASRGALELLHD